MELAARLGISQPHAAKIEQQQDMHLSTLRRYLKGMGGDLKLIVNLSGKQQEIALPETPRHLPDRSR